MIEVTRISLGIQSTAIRIVLRCGGGGDGMSTDKHTRYFALKIEVACRRRSNIHFTEWTLSIYIKLDTHVLRFLLYMLM